MSKQVSTWLKFFNQAGIPSGPANSYAVIFYDHRIQEDMLPDLSKEILRDMGIVVMGDIIAILRHAKEVHAQSERERTAKAMAITDDPATIELASSLPGNINKTHGTGKRKATAASRMVDHWINNHKSSTGGSSSPVHSFTLSPSPSKKKLTIPTGVSNDSSPKVSHKTLSERFGERGIKVAPKKTKVSLSKAETEHTLKVKMPLGTTERSKKLIAKQKQAAAAVNKAKVIKRQSVFDRLGKETSIIMTPPVVKKSEIKALKPLKTSVTVQVKEKALGSVFSRLGDVTSPIHTATVQAVTPRVRLPSSDDEQEIDYTSHSVLQPAKPKASVTSKPVKPVKPVKRSVGLMSDASGKSVFSRLGK